MYFAYEIVYFVPNASAGSMVYSMGYFAAGETELPEDDKRRMNFVSNKCRQLLHKKL